MTLNPAGLSSSGSDFHLEKRREDMMAKSTPEGYHNVRPYLSINREVINTRYLAGRGIA